MRVKWTERSGEIIERGSIPKFLHFLQFVKQRATLVNNEFGEDLATFSSRQKKAENRRTEILKEDLVNELYRHSQQEIATRKRSRTIPYQLRGNVLCVPVNTEFGDVISFEAYLIRIKKDWCKR
jgi:hypothetical protein